MVITNLKCKTYGSMQFLRGAQAAAQDKKPTKCNRRRRASETTNQSASKRPGKRAGQQARGSAGEGFCVQACRNAGGLVNDGEDSALDLFGDGLNALAGIELLQGGGSHGADVGASLFRVDEDSAGQHERSLDVALEDVVRKAGVANLHDGEGLMVEALFREGGGEVVHAKDAEAMGDGGVLHGGDGVSKWLGGGNGVGEVFHGTPPISSIE